MHQGRSTHYRSGLANLIIFFITANRTSCHIGLKQMTIMYRIGDDRNQESGIGSVVAN